MTNVNGLRRSRRHGGAVPDDHRGVANVVQSNPDQVNDIGYFADADETPASRT